MPLKNACSFLDFFTFFFAPKGPTWLQHKILHTLVLFNKNNNNKTIEIVEKNIEKKKTIFATYQIEIERFICIKRERVKIVQMKH